MPRDNDALTRLEADPTISKSNKINRIKRAIATCKTRSQSLKAKIRTIEAKQKANLTRQKKAEAILERLEQAKAKTNTEFAPTSVPSVVDPLYDAREVDRRFGDISVFDGAAMSLAKIKQRYRDAENRLWQSPLRCATYNETGTSGPLSRPADLGSEHAARALEHPGYLHSMMLVKAQMLDVRLLDRVASVCRQAKIQRTPIADAFVNLVFDGDVIERLADPAQREKEIALMRAAVQTFPLTPEVAHRCNEKQEDCATDAD